MKLLNYLKFKWDCIWLNLYIKYLFYTESIRQDLEKYTYEIEDKLKSRENKRRD